MSKIHSSDQRPQTRLSICCDKANNRTKLTYPSGKVLTYTYDANDNLKSQLANSAALANYAYDVLDRRSTKDLVAGAVTQRATNAYDMADQLSSVTNAVLSGAQISKFSYTYDKLGNRLSMTGPAATVTNYTYNPVYELAGTTGAQTHSFAYDLVGNRQTVNGVTYTSNNLNQYSKVGTVTYAYDLNGNLTGNGVNTYVYDEQNRLATSTKAAATSSYKYDAFNRRVSKTVGGTTTYYVYDGDQIIEERSGTATVVADYTYGPWTDEALTMTRAGQTYYYHYDALGSVRNLTNAAGTVIESYDYDPYGNPTANSTVGNPIRFTGRWYDAESGLYDYRARVYDPKIGRFLQRDPWGYWDSMNLFTYVNNDPINWLDPFGLGRFGYRPLGKTPWLKPHKRSGNGNPQDRRNREPFHEQYWADDDWNGGYDTSGVIQEKPGERNKYVMHGSEYDDDTMKQAFDNLKDRLENQGDKYIFCGSGHNNCQDFADRWREEYERLLQQQESENQQCSVGGAK